MVGSEDDIVSAQVSRALCSIISMEHSPVDCIGMDMTAGC